MDSKCNIFKLILKHPLVINFMLNFAFLNILLSLALSSIQYGGGGDIRTFLPPGIFLDLGKLGHFELKIRQEKFTKILNYTKFLCVKLF